VFDAQFALVEQFDGEQAWEYGTVVVLATHEVPRQFLTTHVLVLMESE